MGGPVNTDWTKADVVADGVAELPLPVQLAGPDDQYLQLVTGLLTGLQTFEDDLFSRLDAVDWRTASEVDDLRRFARLAGVSMDSDNAAALRFAIVLVSAARASRAGSLVGIDGAFAGALVEAGYCTSVTAESIGTGCVRVQLFTTGLLPDFVLSAVQLAAKLVAPLATSLNVAEINRDDGQHVAFGKVLHGKIYGRFDAAVR